MTSFAAIDFETADNGRDSACAVAVVVVENGRVAHAVHRYIRPPRPQIQFTRIHGITWDMVKDAPDFGGIWPEIATMLGGVDFLAAHNAPFDRSVLEQCCRGHRLAVPRKPFLCTVQLARDVWDLRPTTLPDVCRHLKIALKHHDAASDAHACAQIVLAAQKAGVSLRRYVPAKA